MGTRKTRSRPPSTLRLTEDADYFVHRIEQHTGWTRTTAFIFCCRLAAAALHEITDDQQRLVQHYLASGELRRAELIAEASLAANRKAAAAASNAIRKSVADAKKGP